jgi:tetratricopeptide (TPR) repeat protein
MLPRGPSGMAGPVLAGLAFAIHPIHSEVVNYISARSGAIATFGFLGALIPYLAATRGGGPRFVRALLCAASLLLFLVGLGGKEIAIVFLPAVILLELLDPENGSAGRRATTACARGILIVIVAAAYMKWRTVVLTEDLTNLAQRVSDVPGQADLYTGGGRTILQNLMTQTRVFWMYAGLLVFPVDLAVDRFVTVSTSFAEPMVLAATAGLAVLAIALLSQWRRRPIVTFAGGLLVLGLLPTSSIIPLNVLMNEHRMYLPGVGVALLAGYFLAPVMERYGRRAALPLAMVGLAFVALIGLRSREWQDAETLWTANIQASPESFRGHNQVGAHLFTRASTAATDEERVELLSQAIREFEIAAKLYPEWADAPYNLGLAWREMGRIENNDLHWQTSIREFERSRDLARGPFRATFQIATTYAKWGKPDKAIEIFNGLAKDDPAEGGRRKSVYLRPIARVNLERGNTAEAMAVFDEMLENDPADLDARAGRISTLAADGRQSEAVKEIEALLESQDTDPRVWMVAARFYRNESDPPSRPKSIAYFRRALNLGHRPTAAEIREYK